MQHFLRATVSFELAYIYYGDSFYDLQPVWLGFFKAPSTLVPSLHRLMACIFQFFRPLASFSYANWCSATFLASYSEHWTCENLVRDRFYYVTDRTTRIFKRTINDCTIIAPNEGLYFSVLSTSSFIFICYVIWCNISFELYWALNLRKFSTVRDSITLQTVGLGIFKAPSTIVPSLHRIKACIFKLFRHLDSFSCATWCSATFLAGYSELWTCINLVR